MAKDTASPCPSCGTPIADRFCPACGEKALGPHDLTLGHYLHELVHGFTHADGKLWNSLRATTLRPGELSLAYMQGRRTAYMRPVPLFLVLNLIYFLFPAFETFNTGLHSQLNFQPYSAWAMERMDRIIAAANATPERFELLYSLKSASNAKLMLIVMVFLLAPIIGLVNWKRPPQAAGHVTFAFELMIFNLLWTTILFGLLMYLIGSIFGWLHYDGRWLFDDLFFSGVAVTLNLWFLVKAGRRYQRRTWIGSAWRAVAVVIGLFWALTVYRFLLFGLTSWQVEHAL